MSIEICNLRKSKPCYSYDFKVDRTSPIGNPFFMANESQRDKVCDNYDKYFYEQMKKSNSFRNTVETLMAIYIQTKRLRLFCWCSPKRCHAETIKKYIEDKLTN